MFLNLANIIQITPNRLIGKYFIPLHSKTLSKTNNEVSKKEKLIDRILYLPKDFIKDENTQL